MKKIAVVCANGKAGKLIVNEAVERGLDVTAVVRGENQTKAQHVLKKDLYDLTVKDLEQFDAVVDAFGAWAEDTLPQHSTSLKHLCDILSGKETRLLVVGGAGSLYVNPEHTACVADGPDFPDVFKPLAAAMAKALGELRERKDVRWTYISPAGDFQAEGEKTGKYILGGEGTMNKKAVSIRGKAENIGSEKLKEVFEENPYMAEIYPQEESRTALEVFRVSEGTGEFFDLSVKPIFRDTFVLGSSTVGECSGQDADKTSGQLEGMSLERQPQPALRPGGYFITEQCRGCRICYSKCPQKCIDMSEKPFAIQQDHCLHCGNCFTACPFSAVVRRK